MGIVDIEYQGDVASFIEELRSKYGELIIVLGHGCCSPTEPMVYRASEFNVGNEYIKVGEVSGVPLYIEGSLAESYRGWVLVLSLERISGPEDTFSIDAMEGFRLKLGFKRMRLSLGPLNELK